MQTEVSSRITGLFDQAVQAFSDSMKAGVKVQEDIAKFWMDSFNSGPIPELQKKSQAIFSDILPVAQKNGEECIKLLETNYRRGTDMLKKAFQSEGNGGKIDLEAKTRELWDASLEAIRDNAQAVTNSNARVIQAWASAMQKGSNGATEHAVGK